MEFRNALFTLVAVVVASLFEIDAAGADLFHCGKIRLFEDVKDVIELLFIVFLSDQTQTPNHPI